MKKTVLLAVAAIFLLGSIAYASGDTWADRRHKERQRKLDQSYKLERQTQRSDTYQIDDINRQISELEYYKAQSNSALERDRYYSQIKQLKTKRTRLERQMNNRSSYR